MKYNPLCAIIGCVVLLLLQLCCSGATYAQTVDYETAAKRLQHKGEWIWEFGDDESRLAAAESIFAQVTRDYPQSEMVKWAKLKTLQCFECQHKYNEQLSLASQIIDTYPGQLVAAWAQWFKGVAYLGLEDYQQAYREFQLVITRYPHISDKGPIIEAQKKFGEILTHSHELAKSGRNMGDILALASDSTQIALTEGTAILASRQRFGWTDAGDLLSAVSTYNDLIIRRSDERSALSVTGIIVGERYLLGYGAGMRQIGSDDKELMEQMIGDAISFAATDDYLKTRAQLVLAKFHFNANNHLRTIELLSGVPESSTQPDLGPEILWSLANAMTSMHKQQDAVNAHQRLIDQWPDSSHCMMSRCILAQAKARTGDFESAIRTAQDIIAKCREFNAPFYGWDVLALIYRDAGMQDLEISALQSAIDIENAMLQDITCLHSVSWRQIVSSSMNRHKTRLNELTSGGN